MVRLLDFGTHTLFIPDEAAGARFCFVHFNGFIKGFSPCQVSKNYPGILQYIYTVYPLKFHPWKYCIYMVFNSALYKSP